MCRDASLFTLKDIFSVEVAAEALDITPIDHHEIRSRTSQWQDSTDMLVFSGGGVTGFKEALQEDGLNAIKAYVSEGGHYLGMCAGAYFGAAQIDFTGHDWQSKTSYKKQSNGLSFFDGIAKGSVDAIAPLYDGTSATCRAIDVTLSVNTSDRRASKTARTASVFYGGGPEFLLSDDAPLTEAQIISRYILDDGGRIPAGISCPVGKGHALLLSWHADLNSTYICHAIDKGTPDPGQNRLTIAKDMQNRNKGKTPASDWLGHILKSRLKL